MRNKTVKLSKAQAECLQNIADGKSPVRYTARSGYTIYFWAPEAGIYNSLSRITVGRLEDNKLIEPIPYHMGERWNAYKITEDGTAYLNAKGA